MNCKARFKTFKVAVGFAALLWMSFSVVSFASADDRDGGPSQQDVLHDLFVTPQQDVTDAQNHLNDIDGGLNVLLDPDSDGRRLEFNQYTSDYSAAQTDEERAAIDARHDEYLQNINAEIDRLTAEREKAAAALEKALQRLNDQENVVEENSGNNDEGLGIQTGPFSVDENQDQDGQDNTPDQSNATGGGAGSSPPGNGSATTPCLMTMQVVDHQPTVVGIPPDPTSGVPSAEDVLSTTTQNIAPDTPVVQTITLPENPPDFGAPTPAQGSAFIGQRSLPSRELKPGWDWKGNKGVIFKKE